MSRNTQTICISSVKEPVAEYNLLTILIVDFKNVIKACVRLGSAFGFVKDMSN